MSRNNLQDLRICMTWFMRENFNLHGNDGPQCSVYETNLSNHFGVRVRGDNAQLMAIDTAVNFYSEEIDPDMTIDFV